MEGWGGDCGYGDETTRALEQQLRDLQLPKILDEIEQARKKHQENLRKQIKKLGAKPVA
jgi:hypothetical protein